MTDARIPDHCGWAARGYWRVAYEAAVAELRKVTAERDTAVGNLFITRVERDDAEGHEAETANELRTVRARAEAAEAEVARLAAKSAALEPDPAVVRMREALRDLVAIVRGECPSILNEDSGGNGELSIEIDRLLGKSK